VENDFTITAGTVDTGSDYILTVDGDVSVTGTLTGNASAISLGSLTIESGGTYSATSGTTTITSFINDKSIVNNSGTFTNNDGTVVIDVTNSNKTMVDARATYHNLTINSDGSNKEVELNNQAATIEGNLTVQEGKLFTYATSGRHLTVTGDVSIEDGGEIDMNNAAGKNATFGSLTIASGGEYSATSGTTTITKNTGTTGVTGRAFYVHTSGTFTHNNGLMKFTSADADTQVTGQSVSKNPFYDLETTSTYEPKEANETAVLNNATFANNVTFQDSARYIKVLGICRFVSGEYNRNNNSTNANHYFGTLIIEGGTFELAPMEITVGSLRNLGGTIS
jgi:polyisoprenoid-binding protein YceI